MVWSVRAARTKKSGETAVTIRGDNLGKSPADVVQVLIAGVDCTPTLTWMSSHKLMVTTRAGVGNVFEERGGGGQGWGGEGRRGGECKHDAI